MSDLINHPPHYKHGDIECIQAIKAALGDTGFSAYCKGNVIKYCGALSTRAMPMKITARLTGTCVVCYCIMSRFRAGHIPGTAVLTPQNAIDIRQRAAGGETMLSIAITYGISIAHVSDIVNRKRWKNAEQQV